MWDGQHGEAGERQVDRVVLSIGAGIAFVAAVVVLLTQGYASALGDRRHPTGGLQAPPVVMNVVVPLGSGSSTGAPVLAGPAEGAVPGAAARPVPPSPVRGSRSFSSTPAPSFSGSAPAASAPAVPQCTPSVLGSVIGLVAGLLGGSSGC
jgi:hypothetical protein